MDNTIYYKSYTASTDSWGDWSVIPTGATIDGPGAMVIGNVLCTVVRGMDGNSLWCGEVDLGKMGFLGWKPLSDATPSPPTLAG